MNSRQARIRPAGKHGESHRGDYEHHRDIRKVADTAMHALHCGGLCYSGSALTAPFRSIFRPAARNSSATGSSHLNAMGREQHSTTH